MRSQETRRIFREFDADMDAGSLDEAYLDVSDYCKTHGLTGAVRPRADGFEQTRGFEPVCTLRPVCQVPLRLVRLCLAL